MKSLASHHASTIFRFFTVCFVSTLILCAAPFLAHAEEASSASVGSSVKGGYYDVDGTHIGDSSGAALMGFDTRRYLTESAKRQNGQPMGKTLGLVPSELSILGGYIDGRTSGYEPTQLDDLAVFNIPNKNMGNLATIIDITSDGNPNDINSVSRYPGKTVAADVNGDGIDEIAFYYYNKDSTTEYNYFLDIFDTRSGKRLSSTPLTKYINVGDFNSTLWNSIFQIAAGDFDGNGCDDIAVYCYAYGNKSSTAVTFLKTFYFDKNDSSDAFLGESKRYDIYRENTGSAPRTIYDNGFVPTHLVAGDVNDDGNDDVILAHQAQPGEFNTSLMILYTPQGRSREAKFVLERKNIAPSGRSTVAQMGSVQVGDIDNDGYQELVVGGYCGSNPDRGELYLAYLEWNHNKEEMDWTFKGYTELTDDRGTAATTGSSLNNHNSADTSLYLGAGGDKGMKWSRYVCSNDWTVPLATVSLSGMVNENTYDQVFFGMWFYELKDGYFSPYQNTRDFPLSELRL